MTDHLDAASTATPAPSGVRRTPPDDSGPPDAAPSRRRTLRPLLLRLHFYAGVLVAPLLAVAAITGLLYTVAPSLEPIVNRQQLQVAVPAGATALPLADQVAAARRAEPRGVITTVVPSPEPGTTTRVNLGGVPGVTGDDQRTVFVDPYRGAVTGELTTYGAWLPMRAWLDDLHRSLLLGSVGRLYSETAASWLWVVALGGLALWVGRRRRRRGGGLRRLLVPDRGITGRRRTVSLHGALGAWLILGMLALSATGLTWSQFAGQNVSDLRERLGWTQPAVTTGAGAGSGGAHSGHGGGTGAAPTPETEQRDTRRLDGVVGAARERGLGEQLEVTMPAVDGDAFAVNESKRSWPVAQDAVAVDGLTSEVVDERRFADWPIAAKLARWGIDAHMGLLFGVANQIALALLAIGILVMVGLGYRMWWRRRPTRDRMALGRAWPRGALRQAPRWAWVAVPVLAVAVGVFAPLLGVTLVAFLLIDAALAMRARRGAPST